MFKVPCWSNTKPVSVEILLNAVQFDVKTFDIKFKS